MRRLLRRASRTRRTMSALVPMAVILAVVVGLPHAVAEGCPNSCSMNGDCSTDNTCSCYATYSGADCSKRSCPTGVAYAQKATATDTVHSAVECSNAGICNTDTGQCDCFTGHEGAACQRTSCPNDCSGRGRCATIQEISTLYGPDTDSGTMGDGAGPSYTLWDAEVTYGCVCDWGYTGGDCSQRHCPHGDDFVTTGQYDRAITFTTDNTVDAAISGYFQIVFDGHRSGHISADATVGDAQACKEAFESMENIETARCLRGDVSGTNKQVATYTVAMKFATYGMNNLFYHDSSIPLSSFTCDGSQATAASGTVSCAISDLIPSMTTSGDNNAGGSQTILVEIDNDYEYPNTFKWSVDNGAYTTGVAIPVGLSVTLQNSVVVTFAARTGYTIGQVWTLAVSNTDSVLVGVPTQVEHEACGGRGICDTSTGSCTCSSHYEGLFCGQEKFFMAETDDPKLHLVDYDTTYRGNMLIIETERSESASFNIILAKTQGTEVFKVTGEGKVSMKDATVSGAVTANQFVSSTGATINAVGLQVDAGGATFSAGPLLVEDGGAEITSAESATPALTVTGTHTTFSSSVLKISSSTTGSSAFNLLELEASGSTKFVVDGTGAVTTAGGVTIDSGGLTVTGGLNVVDTGFTVVDGGVHVTDSATNGGLVMLATNTGFAANVIHGKTTRSSNAAFNMLLLEAAGTDLFSVDGTGTTTVHQVRAVRNTRRARLISQLIRCVRVG